MWQSLRNVIFILTLIWALQGHAASRGAGEAAATCRIPPNIVEPIMRTNFTKIVNALRLVVGVKNAEALALEVLGVKRRGIIKIKKSLDGRYSVTRSKLSDLAKMGASKKVIAALRASIGRDKALNRFVLEQARIQRSLGVIATSIEQRLQAKTAEQVELLDTEVRTLTHSLCEAEKARQRLAEETKQSLQKQLQETKKLSAEAADITRGMLSRLEARIEQLEKSGEESQRRICELEQQAIAAEQRRPGDAATQADRIIRLEQELEEVSATLRGVLERQQASAAPSQREGGAAAAEFEVQLPRTNIGTGAEALVERCKAVIEVLKKTGSRLTTNLLLGLVIGVAVEKIAVPVIEKQFDVKIEPEQHKTIAFTVGASLGIGRTVLQQVVALVCAATTGNEEIDPFSYLLSKCSRPSCCQVRELRDGEAGRPLLAPSSPEDPE